MYVKGVKRNCLRLRFSHPFHVRHVREYIYIYIYILHSVESDLTDMCCLDESTIELSSPPNSFVIPSSIYAHLREMSYVCMYIYIYIYIYIHTHVYAFVYIYIYIYTHIHIHIHIEIN